MSIYRQANHNSVLGIANLLHKQSGLFAVFLAPLTLGLGSSLRNACSLDDSRFDVVERYTSILDTYPAGCCRDKFLWLLPLHPIDGALKKLERLILWDGELSIEARERAFNSIVTLARARQRHSQFAALRSLAHLVYGHSLKDYPKLKEGYDGETLRHLLSIKTRSLKTLQDIRDDFNEQKRLNYQLINSIYSDYLLWSLGYSPSKKTSLVMSLFKGSKTATQILFLKMIVEALIQYFNCPERPGLSWNGYQPWSSSYSKKCFDELVRQFNTIPGQPANSLVGNLTQYYFPGNKYALNLSGKDLAGETVLEIVEAFNKTGITLTALDLAGNSFNKAPLLRAILSQVPFLQSLNLSDSDIERGLDSQATIALAQSFTNLTSLTSLDLSRNCIGCADSLGAITIGDSLQHLTSLTALDLSGNPIGLTDSQGTIAIGNSLRYLTSLTSLGLSTASIGRIDSQGTVAIGNSLQHLKNLQTLRLSYNRIGSTDKEGPLAILSALPHLQQLKVLDLRTMTNITWTDAAEALTGLNRERTRRACEQELCFATPIRPIIRQPHRYLEEIHLDTLEHTPSSFSMSFGNASIALITEEIDNQLVFTSAAAESSSPAGIWKFVAQSVDYGKSWFTFDAWMNSISQVVYNLAIEKDADGRFINNMPATFPNLLNPDIYDWAIPTDRAPQLFNGTSPLVPLVPIATSEFSLKSIAAATIH